MDGHEVACGLCTAAWTCYCAPGEADPARCLFGTCDACALAALDAAD